MKLERFRKAESPEALKELIYGQTPEDLAHVIFNLVQTEKHYSAAEIAELEGMDAKTIRRDIKAGLFGGEYFNRNGKSLRVSASGVAAWRELFRVKVQPQH